MQVQNQKLSFTGYHRLKGINFVSRLAIVATMENSKIGLTKVCKGFLNRNKVVGIVVPNKHDYIVNKFLKGLKRAQSFGGELIDDIPSLKSVSLQTGKKRLGELFEKFAEYNLIAQLKNKGASDEEIKAELLKKFACK